MTTTVALAPIQGPWGLENVDTWAIYEPAQAAIAGRVALARQHLTRADLVFLAAVASGAIDGETWEDEDERRWPLREADHDRYADLGDGWLLTDSGRLTELGEAVVEFVEHGWEVPW